MNIPILYINLDRTQMRNDKMVDKLNKLKANFERISGIDSQYINKNALKKGECAGMKYNIKDNIIFKPKSKEIAIILSHMKALNKIIENNWEIAIIMEDDLSFQYIPNWNDKITKIITNAPSNWKILKLHTSFADELNKNISLSEKNIFYTPLSKNAINSAGCYIITKNAALELINKYKINDIYTFPNQNEYCVCECIVFSLTDIYMYTTPYICVDDNNMTCTGGKNPADIKTNFIIHSYWKNKNNDTQNEENLILFSNNYSFKTDKHKIKTLKDKLIEKRNKKILDNNKN